MINAVVRPRVRSFVARGAKIAIAKSMTAREGRVYYPAIGPLRPLSLSPSHMQGTYTGRAPRQVHCGRMDGRLHAASQPASSSLKYHRRSGLYSNSFKISSAIASRVRGLISGVSPTSSQTVDRWAGRRRAVAPLG